MLSWAPALLGTQLSLELTFRPISDPLDVLLQPPTPTPVGSADIQMSYLVLGSAPGLAAFSVPGTLGQFGKALGNSFPE